MADPTDSLALSNTGSVVMSRLVGSSTKAKKQTSMLWKPKILNRNDRMLRLEAGIGHENDITTSGVVCGPIAWDS